MSPSDDDLDMRDDTAEQVLSGADVPGERALVDLVATMRAQAQQSAPAPNAALAALLRDGLPAARLRPDASATAGVVGAAPGTVRTPARVRLRRRLGRAARWAAGLGVAAKLALGTGVAMAAVTGAATLPGVPDAVQQPARAVVDDVAHWFGSTTGEPASGTPAPSASTSTPAPTGAPATAPPVTAQPSAAPAPSATAVPQPGASAAPAPDLGAPSSPGTSDGTTAPDRGGDGATDDDGTTPQGRTDRTTPDHQVQSPQPQQSPAPRSGADGSDDQRSGAGRTSTSTSTGSTEQTSSWQTSTEQTSSWQTCSLQDCDPGTSTSPVDTEQVAAAPTRSGTT